MTNASTVQAPMAMAMPMPLTYMRVPRTSADRTERSLFVSRPCSLARGTGVRHSVLGWVREWPIRSAGVQGSAGRAGCESRPWLPSRARSLPFGVEDELAIDGVGDAALQ